MMKPELKKEWLKWLRSGRYKKGIGYLCEQVDGEDLYCCLGVLCDIAIQGDWEWNEKERAWLPPDSVRRGKSGFPEGHLNDGAYNKLGLRRAEWRKLGAINDDSDSFREVAQYIEENL